MTCKCKERRAKLLAARERKKAQRKGLQAAALRAVLAVTDAAAKVVGIDNGEVENGDVGREVGSPEGPSIPDVPNH